jgi:hypothetical protein
LPGIRFILIGIITAGDDLEIESDHESVNLTGTVEAGDGAEIESEWDLVVVGYRVVGDDIELGAHRGDIDTWLEQALSFAGPGGEF